MTFQATKEVRRASLKSLTTKLDHNHIHDYELMTPSHIEFSSRTNHRQWRKELYFCISKAGVGAMNALSSILTSHQTVSFFGLLAPINMSFPLTSNTCNVDQSDGMSCYLQGCTHSSLASCII